MNKKTYLGADMLFADRDMLRLAEFKVIGFIAACEPNVNAPCNLTLRAELKDKEEVYVVSQMEDGSIKESTSDDLKGLWRRIYFFLSNVEGRKGLSFIWLTVSTRDGKKKTYAVKDANVLNEKGIEFILGPGPNPNDVPFSTMAEEMGIIMWFSGDRRLNQINFLAPYFYPRTELLFGGVSRYNAIENSLEVRWSDTPVAPGYVAAGALAAPLFAVDIPFARDAATPWYLFFWVQVQIVNEMPIKLFGRDRKGRRMSMVRKVSGYKVEKGKLMLELSSKGLKAKSGDREANRILRGFKSGIYSDVGIIAFDPSSRLSARGSRNSYSVPELPGIMRRGKDGKVRVAFKAGKEKALRYDRETGLISSMDVERFVVLESEGESFDILIQREPDDKEPCVYPYARCSKCGECDIQAKLIGLKKVSEYTWVGGVEFMGEFMGDIVNIAGSGEVVRMRLAWTDKI